MKLNYRFTGNLHVHVFSTYKTRIMTNLNDFIICCTGTGRCCKKSLLRFFISTHFIFSESWFSRLCWILSFQPNFLFFFLIFLDSLASVNIHVIKIIKWTLTDVWHVIFSSDLTDILFCIGIGIGSKSIVVLKFCAQPYYASNWCNKILYP